MDLIRKETNERTRECNVMNLCAWVYIYELGWPIYLVFDILILRYVDMLRWHVFNSFQFNRYIDQIDVFAKSVMTFIVIDKYNKENC